MIVSASVGRVRCPACGESETKVVDSRSADEETSVRRRRSCTDCDHRFTTFERVEEVPLRVHKRSGSVTDFDEEKIVSGLIAACKGRPLTRADFEQIAVRVGEGARSEGGDVTSEWVGLAVLEQLREMDPVAYLRFASVYKGFDNLADFEREARLIKVDSEAAAASEAAEV